MSIWENEKIVALMSEYEEQQEYVDSEHTIFLCPNGDNPEFYYSFALNSLKAYLAESTNKRFPPETLVRRENEMNWVPLYTHPLFQRRKPQLVSNNSLKEADPNSIYIIHYGQKVGPLDPDEIHKMIDDSTLLVTDVVSLDGGVTFNKIHQLSEFDRRKNMGQKPLPDHVPGGIAESSKLEILSTSNMSASRKRTESAITNLAITEHKIKNSNDEHYIEEQSEKSSKGIPQWSIAAMVFALVCTVSFSMFDWPFKGQPKQARKVASVKKQAQIKKKVAIQKAKLITKKPKAKTVRKAKPKRRNAKAINSGKSRRNRTFKNSKAFKKARPIKKKRIMQKTAIIEEDPYPPYDDASDPVMLDPIRSKISGETLEPDSYDDQFDDEDDEGAARGIASVDDEDYDPDAEDELPLEEYEE